MHIVDCSSTLDELHPIHRSGASSYLLAPDPRTFHGEPSGFMLELKALDPRRMAGGLLPVWGLERAAFSLALQEGVFRGLLLSPDYASKSSLEDAELFTRLELGALLPVVLDSGRPGFSRPEHLEGFLRAFQPQWPERPVVLTHGGQLNISGGHLSAAGELFLRFPQTLLETSGIYRQDFLEEMLQALGTARLLYGSAYPMMHEELELERVSILPVDPAELEAIVGGNAARIFGLGQA